MLRAGKVLAVFPEGVAGGGPLGEGGAAYWRWCQGAHRPGRHSRYSRTWAVQEPGAPLGQTDPRCVRRAIQGTSIFLATPQAAVAEWTEVVRQRLADHVVAAQALTGCPCRGHRRSNPPSPPSNQQPPPAKNPKRSEYE